MEEATADAGEHSTGSGLEDEKPAKTLVDWALEILSTADPDEKARLGDLAASLWLRGDIPLPYDPSRPSHAPPDRPARSDAVRLLPPSRGPKLGKGGSAQSRLAMLHSLAHTESWAVDLSWDIVARFGAPMRMPREFFDDFARVAQDEGPPLHRALRAAQGARLALRRAPGTRRALGLRDAHVALLARAPRCRALRPRGEGQLPGCLARGLDVLPTTISRFRAGGDEQTAKILEDVIYPEEITHCAAGVRWFRYLCLRSRHDDPIARSVPHPVPDCSQLPGDGSPDAKAVQRVGDELTSVNQDVENERTSKVVQGVNGKMAQEVEDRFAKCELGNNAEKDEAAVIRTFHKIVREYFRGPLKPPFNNEARKAAGFEPVWYEPLVVKEVYVEEETMV
ncbi:hypothetical protein PR202_ga25674 [Eleusine coracana subsp. coracana]|uniref:Uncharacterized protein n=1 Tax=Eleusine coracana subsp. coracana TaxID=191504 RepID=A0AAV5DCV9_ELECO|nr:hypothetical protein PR202_ga25674 [Eleusine coracana subsp. coracana]